MSYPQQNPTPTSYGAVGSGGENPAFPQPGLPYQAQASAPSDPPPKYEPPKMDQPGSGKAHC